MKQPAKPDFAAAKKSVQQAAQAIKSKLPDLPGGSKRPSPADIAAARLKVGTYLERVKKSKIGGSPEVSKVEAYLIDHVSRGGKVESLAEELANMSKAEAAKHKGAIDYAAGLAGLLRDPGKRQRFGKEVLAPAKMRRLSSQEAWDRTDAIMGRSVLRESGGRVPGWTICIGAAADVGVAIGWEGSSAIGGFRHHMACYEQSQTIAVGAYCGLSVAGQVEFSPGTPLDLPGIAVCVGVGGTIYVGIDLNFGWVPLRVEEKPPDGRLGIVWKFDGFSVGIGAGGEIELSIGFEYSEVWTLDGRVE